MKKKKIEILKLTKRFVQRINITNTNKWNGRYLCLWLFSTVDNWKVWAEFELYIIGGVGFGAG